MSLPNPTTIPAVPEATAVVARAAFPRGNRYLTMRDELGVFYSTEEFARLFSTRGQPAETPWRLALVLVFQFVEGLSDEQAAEAVRSRIDWKYALSLELTDTGFDASVLSEFRTRLIGGGAELQLLDTMLRQLQAAGYLRARGRQRSDSTQVLAAVRSVSRLVCVGETLRQALNTLAGVAPGWLKPQLVPAWVERYAVRFDDYRLPKDKGERQVLAEQIGADGRTLLQLIYAPSTPAWLRAIPAVETLRQVWVQQFYAVADDAPLRWRAEEDLPPAAQRIASPYDVEAHISTKRTTTWLGYKVHLTETCDEEAPHLITHVLTTPAPTPDFDAPAAIQAELAAKDLLPAEHFLDAGYGDAGLLVSSQQEHQIEVIGPVAPDHSWQALSPTGFDVSCFTIDWDAHVVTCPQGHPSRKWSETHDQHGNPIINLRFDAHACALCPVRQHCTQAPSGPRHMTLRPREQHAALQQRRLDQQTPEFKARYHTRAGIEGTLSQAVRITDLRHARYLGLAKTHRQQLLGAVALNLRRMVDWLTDQPRARTRTAPFVLLATATAAP